MGFVLFSVQAEIISLNSVTQLIFVMVKCCVFFAVRTEFLNIILTSFGFKGLIRSYDIDLIEKTIHDIRVTLYRLKS
jgi:hypothetical protein